MTIKDRVQSLITQLAGTLTDKGVEASSSETLTSLVDKVDDIKAGGGWKRPAGCENLDIVTELSPSSNFVGVYFTMLIPEKHDFTYRFGFGIDTLKEVTINPDGTYNTISTVTQPANGFVDFSQYQPGYRTFRCEYKANASQEFDDYNSYGSDIYVEAYIHLPLLHLGQYTRQLGEHMKVIGAAPTVTSWARLFSKSQARLQKLEFDHCDFSNITDLSDLCSGDQILSEISFTDCTGFDNIQSLNNAFADTDIEELDLSFMDFSGVTNTGRIYYRCPHLKSIKLPSDAPLLNTNGANSLAFDEVAGYPAGIDIISFPHIYVSFAANNTALTAQSLMAIINALPETESALTLTLGSGNQIKLTAQQIAVATNKGWTVA